MTLGALRNIVLPRGEIGGSFLLRDEQDGVGMDLTYRDIYEQLRIKDRLSPLNSFRGRPQGKLTYTSPSVKWTQRQTGKLVATNGTTDLPYEWDTAGNFQGLLIEEARTNLALWSSIFEIDTTWTVDGTSVSQDAVVSPDGLTKGDTITAAAGTGTRGIYQTGMTGTASAVYTGSVYAKKGNHRYINLVVQGDSVSWAAAVFDLDSGGTTATQTGVGSSAGTIVSTSMVSMGNGWFRLVLVSSHGTPTTMTMNCQFAGAATGNTYESTWGDIITTTAGTETFHLWGSQVELGSFATSPIETFGSSVTRAADNISMATTLFNLSATVGTLYAKFKPINVGAIRFAAVLDDGTANERFALGSSAAGAGSFSVIDGGAAQTAPLTSGTVAAGAVSRAAASWVASDFALSVNGGAVATDVAGTLPTVTSLKLGTAVSAASPLNGWLQHLVYLPRAMSDPELVIRST